ncbi:zinc finger, CCHC-type containing protein [Tanacetum coccineum]
MDEAIQVSCIIDKLPLSWKDFKHILKHKKKELTLVDLGSHLHIEESLKVQDSDKPKGNNVVGPSVLNMVEHNNSIRIEKVEKLATKPMVQAQMVDSGETVHMCKDRCWFKTYESLNDGSIIHIGNESTAMVHRRGCVNLRFSSGKIVSLLNVLHVPNIRKNLVSSTFMSTSKLNDSILWHVRLGHIHFKRMQDMFKDGLIPAFNMDIKKCKTCMLTTITKKPFQNVKRKTNVLELIHSDLCDLHATPSLGNKKYFVIFIDDASRFCYIYLLHIKDEALDKFKVFKTEVELQQVSLIKRFRTDKGGEYMGTLYFQSISIIYVTTAPYTPQQNGISERKNRVLKEMVNFILSYLGLSQGFWGERGIECIIVGYAEYSKAFRFYVIKPNELVSINSIIELRDPIFDENRFSSVPRPSQRSLINGTEDISGSVVPKEVTEEVVAQQPELELRKGKRDKTLIRLNLLLKTYIYMI